MVEALPGSVTFEEGALVEPFAVAMHAVAVTPLAAAGTIAIVGAGTIGLLALLAVRAMGAGKILVTDRVPHRLAVAKELGADITVDVRTADPVAALKAATDGAMADVVLEAVGLDATSRQSVALVRTGGHVTWIGNSDPSVSLNMQDVVSRELTLRGAYGADAEFEQAIEAIRLRPESIRRLIDRIEPLEHGPGLMTALARGELDATKVILRP
jgi:L-iditol 2-dehydrogenase